MARPRLNSIEAQLFVADVRTACDFYVGKLGFETVFTYGTPPFYAQVKRDSVAINFRLVCEPVYVGDIRDRKDLLAGSITLETAAELEELFAAYQAAGVPFYQPIEQKPWGARDFIVRDPDGNLLLFAGPAA